MVAATPNESRPVRQRRERHEPPRTLWSDLGMLRSQLAAAIEARPLAAAATAAGIGFVLGGGLTRATIAVLIQTGSRVAANWLGEAIHPLAPENVDVAAEEHRG
jgi:hypothetical protein